jgi:hypothetical protein
MQLDIRYPIGLLFIVIGGLLVAYGLTSNPGVYALHSLGININLGWGAFQFAFGILMIALARRAAKKSGKR